MLNSCSIFRARVVCAATEDGTCFHRAKWILRKWAAHSLAPVLSSNQYERKNNLESQRRCRVGACRMHVPGRQVCIYIKTFHINVFFLLFIVCDGRLMERDVMLFQIPRNKTKNFLFGYFQSCKQFLKPQLGYMHFVFRVFGRTQRSPWIRTS